MGQIRLADRGRRELDMQRPLNLSKRSFSAFATAEDGREFARLPMLSDSIVCGRGGQDEQGGRG